MNRLLSFLLVILISTWCRANRAYVQDKVIRLQPKTEGQINYLRDLEDSAGLDFWTDVIAPTKPVDLHLKANEYDYYISQFKERSLSYDVLINDLQEIIDNEQQEIMKDQMMRQAQSRQFGQQTSRIVGTYASYNDIVGFLQEKVSADPQHIEVIDIGRTFENRLIKAIVLKLNPSAKRNIWVDCGIHAREWITPATCVWMIDKLISEYKSNDPVVRDLLNYWNVYIAPSLNPDGYEYSRIPNNRLWRKSRAKYPTSTCYGVDLNRNYPQKWMTGGASSNPCSETYAGASSMSESETKAVVNFLTSKIGTWDMYMSFHSYGQWWFTPYGYSTNLPAKNSKQIELAKAGADVITSVNGRRYTLGTVARLLYIASGSTVDWAHDMLNITYSYTIELPPTQSESSTGFVLPPERAPGVCNETYLGMKAFMVKLKQEVLQSSMG